MSTTLQKNYSGLAATTPARRRIFPRERSPQKNRQHIRNEKNAAFLRLAGQSREEKQSATTKSRRDDITVRARNSASQARARRRREIALQHGFCAKLRKLFPASDPGKWKRKKKIRRSWRRISNSLDAVFALLIRPERPQARRRKPRCRQPILFRWRKPAARFPVRRSRAPRPRRPGCDGPPVAR